MQQRIKHSFRFRNDVLRKGRCTDAGKNLNSFFQKIFLIWEKKKEMFRSIHKITPYGKFGIDKCWISIWLTGEKITAKLPLLISFSTVCVPSDVIQQTSMMDVGTCQSNPVKNPDTSHFFKRDNVTCFCHAQRNYLSDHTKETIWDTILFYLLHYFFLWNTSLIILHRSKVLRWFLLVEQKVLSGQWCMSVWAGLWVFDWLTFPRSHYLFALNWQVWWMTLMCHTLSIHIPGFFFCGCLCHLKPWSLLKIRSSHQSSKVAGRDRVSHLSVFCLLSLKTLFCLCSLWQDQSYYKRMTQK